MNIRTKLALIASAVFIAAAVLYGQWSSSSSSSEPEASFTAEGVVVDRIFQKEHYTTPQPYPSKRQYGHAEERAKVWDQYLINVKLDNGEMMKGTCAPELVDQFPVGQRVHIQGVRKSVMFFGKKNLIQTMVPIESSPGK